MKRIKTGIFGLDDMIGGGLPEGGVYALCGDTGTGKTTFGIQFLMEGLKNGEKCLYITFEKRGDRLKDLFKYSFGWDLEKYEKKGLMKMYESPVLSSEKMVSAFILPVFESDFMPSRIVIDPISAPSVEISQKHFRNQMQELFRAIYQINATTLLTSEMQYGIDPEHVVRFLCSGSFVLHHSRMGDKKQRMFEVLKIEGVDAYPHLVPFRITDRGMEVYPLPKYTNDWAASGERISTGVKGIDDMMNGGVFRGDVTLVAGSTGTGKTLMGMQFIMEGAKKGEKGLIVSLEETRELLLRNAEYLGYDLKKMEGAGMVRIMTPCAIDMIPEEYLRKMESELDGVKRVVIDSLSSYHDVFESKSAYKDHLVIMPSMFKNRNITSILISEMPQLFGAFQITNSGTSFVVDNVILLRYVEVESEIQKAISIIKMRGSHHDRDIKRMDITKKGIVIESKFEGIEGLMGGGATTVAKRIEGFFK
ncbi:MAG: hypothetical protein MSIBF_04030 [Candidatus Altiarchaeales archaeon IMC4]|nr:MAG: hypothetical protein MSIBF_04030 [Candidatus Altiarchaeales archaeon IMC4]